jgi:asparagine synthase (glutamine-hydrolysing)
VCGIAGIVGRPGEFADAATIHRMCQTLVHRGPDDEGIYIQGNVGLGMRRLSIIDLAGGQQPIHNEDRSVWAVFNGEIYNFPELRRELEARGHHFYTHSDTETIVHLYEEMGADCVSKLRGMFAIALYDERRQRLVLARDRLGKKPLYYALCDGRLLFGSEIKALLAVAPQLAEVDPEGILQYFYFGYIPDPFSAFQRIQKLPPGNLLEYTGTASTIRQYWDLPSYGSHPPGSEEECLEELDRRLTEAVRMRLVSDVPLGALLSGGIDSSIIVALMAKASRSRVKTFTVGFRAEDFNESKYARMVAERFGTDHHELIVEPNIQEILDDPYLSGVSYGAGARDSCTFRRWGRRIICRIQQIFGRREPRQLRFLAAVGGWHLPRPCASPHATRVLWEESDLEYPFAGAGPLFGYDVDISSAAP